MAERIGVCGDCKAKFKIPPTFQGAKAKCKKCGGVVNIPAAEAETPKPAAAPKKPAQAKKAAPQVKKKPAAAAPEKPVRKSSMASRRAAGKGGTKARGGRRTAKAEESSDTKKWILIGGGVTVVAIIILVILFSGNGDEEQPVVDSTTLAKTEEVAPIEEAPVLEPETDPEPEVKEAPEPESENTVDVPSKEEEVNPIIEFELLPPMADCSQERFDELTEAYTNGYLKEDLPAYKRRKFKKTWDAAKEEGYEMFPVLLNAFNGLDLLTRDDVAMGFRIAQEWNELSGKGYVDLNFKGDITDAEMQENLRNNVVTVTSLISLWQKKYADDGAQQEKFISKVEVARARAAERASKDDDE